MRGSAPIGALVPVRAETGDDVFQAVADRLARHGERSIN
jgi:hypothetical protein